MKQPEDIEREVATIRSEMDPVLTEIDRRRHELFDWRLQLRRHRVGLFGLAAAGIVGFTLMHRVRRRRRARATLATRTYATRAPQGMLWG